LSYLISAGPKMMSLVGVVVLKTEKAWTISYNPRLLAYQGKRALMVRVRYGVLLICHKYLK
jgi:hypothetical protein